MMAPDFQSRKHELREARDPAARCGPRSTLPAWFRFSITALLVLGTVLLVVRPAITQQPPESPPVSIVAGRIEVLADSQVLIASGGVTIHHRDQIVRTERLTYNQLTKRLSIDEPLVLVTEDGVAIAELARLSDDLEDGVIRSVQILTRRQLQLAANSMHLSQGRYRILTNAVASSCRICRTGDTPDWQVRADEVLYDELEQRIYFENAVLEVAGIPVLHVPSLSIPGPDIDRASGFLVPTIITSTVLGTGFKLPYYIARSDHDDVTLTPFVTTEGGAVLETEYRRNFRSGQILIDGAVLLAGGIGDDRLASYIAGSGQFALPRDFHLEFDASLASNKSFTALYGYEKRDRLVSEIDIERTRADSHLGFGASLVQSLRMNEIDQQVPLVLPEFHYRQITRPSRDLGTIGFRAHAVNLSRKHGNRLFRFGAHVDWKNRWQVWHGVQLGVSGEIVGLGYNFNDYKFTDDSEVRSGSTGSVDPAVAVDMRWPLGKTTRPGVQHRLEPIIQLIWRPNRTHDTPKEDGDLVEFEAANLFSFNRFPGYDQMERGITANVGASYGILTESGFSADAMIGQVLRYRDLGQFSDEPDLSGRSSDYVVSLNMSLRDQLELTTLGVFDSDFRFSKFEQEATYRHGRFETSLSFVSLAGSEPSRELILSARYNLSDVAQLRGSLRRNLESHKTTEAEIGFSIRNECTAIDFFFSLDAAGTGIVVPDRQIGLTIELLGLSGAISDPGYSRNRCGARVRALP
ncbi:MAG: LPS assembly protein LptD [Rhodobacteraceae bacterium]|nr:LPS assembly protein LptD [Paracoccaceae bacterium]